MRPRLLHAAIAAACLVAPLHAQTVLRTPTATIELIGLRRWTVAMIEDSLEKYSPADKLTAHACAAILRDKLHFADAAVNTYTGFPEYGFKEYVAITIVEPQDSARIRYKPAFRDSVPVRAEWAEAVEVFKKENGLAQQALQSGSFFDAHLSPADSAKFEKLEPLHRLIASSRTHAAFVEAVRALNEDAGMWNRMIAAIIVGNFADRDSAWFALVDAQRDPVGSVGGTASQVLRSMTIRAPRTVDWRPISGQLRYLLDGTNLFAFNGTLKVLTETKVGSSLAPALLGNGGGNMLRAKLHSGDVLAKREVRSFLSQISGLPATADDAVLERWMDSLDSGAKT
ncbi:MAG TPA: hypothetical protein VIP11_00960, partial [Gemmatimonadaceae bacterium]